MWGSVKIKTKPAALPISLADMKLRLRVDDDAQDALITDLINTAVGMIDGPDGIGVAIMSQTWTLALDCFSRVIELPGGPITSVSAVRYLDAAGDWQTVDAATYRLVKSQEPARLVLATGQVWPACATGFGVVEVDYILGVADVVDAEPALVTAVALLVGNYFENREAVVVGVASGELPLGVRHILNARRRGVVAG